MYQTIAEKIISSHCRRAAYAGETVVAAIDLALYMVGRLGSSGANYKSLEFYGPPLLSFDMDDRLTICNMMVETGAKCTIMPFDQITEKYLARTQSKGFNPIAADQDAVYEEIIQIDLNRVAAQATCLSRRPLQNQNRCNRE